jgi:ankyrin repeat protein
LPPLPPPPPNGPAGHATPLHAAAKSANLAELTRLIAASPRDIDAPDERGLTALHLACAGSLGVARLLLDAGARSLPNKAGKTPFDLAQAKGSPALAELLKTAR